VRVLITGVDGLIGRSAAWRFAGRGDDVIGVANARPVELPSGITFVAVREHAAIAEAWADVDVLIHCGHGIDDTRRLIASAEAAGVKRAVFVCAGASPSRDAEALFAASAVPSVLVRTGVVLGRGVDGRARESLTGRALVTTTAGRHPWSVVHHDDVARFLLVAADSELTGPVHLATADPVDPATVEAILGNGSRRGQSEPMPKVPLIDVNDLADRWQFALAWTGLETVEDTRLAVHAIGVRRGRVARRRGRTPYPHQIVPADIPAADGAPLAYSGPDGLRGEFDTPIDVRFPVYSQTNLAEALPGPSSALTIDVQGRALRGTTSAVAEMLGLPEVLRVESARLQAVHAHRMYVNGSGAYHVALAMPGSNPESMAEQFTGTHADDLPGGFDAVAGTYVPPSAGVLATVRTAMRVGPEIVAMTRRAAVDIAEVRTQTARLEGYLGDVRELPAERLEVLLLLARDLLAYAWTVQGVVNLVGGAALEVASKISGDANLGNGDDLESGATLRGVRLLAAEAAADPALMALLADRSAGLPDRVAQEAPWFWAHVSEALNKFGHRGPAESEFDARSFADDVQGFLSTVGRAASTIRTEQPDGVKAGPVKRNWAQKLAVKMLTLRENNRDRCVRLTWVTRRLALEHGGRLAVQGRIEAARDVFQLTMAELLDPPADVATRVVRRKAERARLALLHMPPIFEATWAASDVLPPLQPGETLTGIGICKGKVIGRARLVDPDTIDDLEPDEIMIAHVTDVGYTALFGHCGAVVTDIGGLMSHAAVVAREYGVPCVVDTQVAAARIQSGALVEVDGSAGTVTVLEAAPEEALLG
jgi:phosphohistidine swiveling domain-containing protein